MKKNISILILSLLLLVLSLPSSHAQKTTIPSDLRNALNKAEFLASIARHCHVALDFYGAKGIEMEDCTLFKKKGPLVIDEFKKMLLKYPNNYAIEKGTKNLNTVLKTVQYIEFLMD